MQESDKRDVVGDKMMSDQREADHCSSRYREIVASCGCHKAFPFSYLLLNCWPFVHGKVLFAAAAKNTRAGHNR